LRRHPAYYLRRKSNYADVSSSNASAVCGKRKLRDTKTAHHSRREQEKTAS
jgi:hypothetical protein